jgi:hypothetical protein
VDDLENLIRQHIILGKKSPKGFHIVKCACCNDYQERGGWKFDNGVVGFSCFNCGIKAKYDPARGDYTISRNMRKVLVDFGIPGDEIDKSVAKGFFQRKLELEAKVKGEVIPDKPKSLGFPKETQLPGDSSLVTEETTAWATVAKEYLKIVRGLDAADYPYYVSTLPAYQGRVIIPYFFRGKVIYWQARSMDEEIQPRYKNPSVEKANVFFNMDEVYRYTDEPLFISEGPIDALSIGKNGVALLGSSLTEFQLQALQKVQNRRIIFVIDKNKNGFKLAQTALANNWHVTVMPGDIDDANDALMKLGRLWLANHLISTAVTGFAGKLLVETMCKR